MRHRGGDRDKQWWVMVRTKPRLQHCYFALTVMGFMEDLQNTSEYDKVY